jgi:hypothetical protein
MNTQLNNLMAQQLSAELHRAGEQARLAARLRAGRRKPRPGGRGGPGRIRVGGVSAQPGHGVPAVMIALDVKPAIGGQR